MEQQATQEQSNGRPIEHIALTIAEAATYLKLTESAVRGRLSRKQLPSIKYWGRVYILKKDLDRVLLLGGEK